MRLQFIVGQLVTLTLAASCSKSTYQRPTGGGCPASQVDEKIGPDIDDAMKALLAACTSEETCNPVCDEVSQRKGGPPSQCVVTKTSDTEATVKYKIFRQCAGRRPCGYLDDADEAITVGEWIARQGALEAASVVAFEQLARELQQHGAPTDLIDACLEAARDEARHAKRCGVTELPDLTHSRRTLEELAIDNAVEGEVRETWGAVIAAWQARTAGSARVRVAMEEIAPDELRHAELSAALAAWYASQLPEAARQRVALAKARAIDQLAASLGAPVADELVIDAGLPDRDDSRRLFAGLRETIWA